MNVIIVGIGIVVAIAIIGILIGRTKKTVLIGGSYVLAVLMLAGGAYLFPANMWRNIAIVLLMIGFLLLGLAVFFTAKVKRVKQAVEARE